MSRIAMWIVIPVLVVLAIAGSFVGGVAFSQVVDVGGLLGFEQPKSTLGERVEEVEAILDREALEPSADESQTAGAVRGLLESLGDPYAMYFNERHYQYFNEQSDGEFFGIGITISEKDAGVVYVVSVIEGTPAQRAGLKADDEIVSIDGVAQEVWTTEEVVKRVRGPEGTKVTLEVRRPGAEEPLTFAIQRARIDIPNLETRLDGTVGYMRLLSFNAKSAEEIRMAIADLDKQGVEGFVLDLRDNPGGLLSSSVEVASLFVEDGVIVRVEERTGPEIVHRARGGVATDKPLVLLVNENSASAAEVVAGALQDYGRARLVGVKTFGKGSVQTVEELSYGGAIKFTVAHYLTPKGRTIDGEGLEPDVQVAMEPDKQVDETQDVQLQRALEEVRRTLASR